MLKKSEYLVMSLSFIFMLGIFLIISVNYVTDTAANNNDLEDTYDVQAYNVDMSRYNVDYIVLYGNDALRKNNVINALNYAKKGNASFKKGEDVPQNILENSKAIIVTTDDLTTLGDFDSIMSQVSKGTNIFFAALPKEGNAVYNRYCANVLGLVSRKGTAKLYGFQAFEGLYAQGKIICYDYPLEVEDVRLDATCRNYIFEYSSDTDKPQDSMVPILWRKVYGTGQVCVLNADFMEHPYSMGLCIATLSSFEENFAYPVVNAKVNFADSFPFLSYENSDAMFRLYNRDSQSFIRDQVWPSFVTMMSDTNIKFTGFYYAYLTDKGASSESNTETISYFKKQFNKYDCEFAFGGYHNDRGSDDKLKTKAYNKSYELFSNNLPTYHLVTYRYNNSVKKSVRNKSLENLKNVGVFVSKQESTSMDDYVAELSVAEGNIINLPIVCDEVEPKYEDFWKACNMASGLGYTSHYFDLYDVITNQNDYDYEWMAYSQNLSKTFNLLNRGINWLTPRTASQTSYYARRYLCIMPEITFTDNEVNIKCDNFDSKASFIIKTDKKLKADEARFSATKLSDEFYLVEIYRPDVTIQLIG